MELSDYLEIQNTIHLFFQHIDSGDSTSFATLFSENASLEIIDETMNTNKTMSGKDQMIGFCNFLHNKFKGAQHWEGNLVVNKLENGVVTNKSYWKAIHEGQIISLGRHEDVLKKVDDKHWVFESRKVYKTWAK